MAGERLKDKIRKALEDTRPGISLNGNDYVRRFQDNLLPSVWREDFEGDLHKGDGNELSSKFCAPHSSAALAVNWFAPFRRKLVDLPNLPGQLNAFEDLRFEAKCSTGVSKPDPNLDVLLCNSNEVIGIESKFTEHCGSRWAKKGKKKLSSAQEKDLSSAKKYLNCKTGIRDRRRDQNYFKEMERLANNMEKQDIDDTYKYLDAMQLIKHSFGLDRLGKKLERKFKNPFTITLLYIYWEPDNLEDNLEGGVKKFEPFIKHREEVKTFSDKVKGSMPAFKHISYPCLWDKWEKNATGWVSKHLCDLKRRYRISI